MRKTHRLKSVTFVFQRERVLKMRMKEKKRAKQKMANAEHKVRVATAFRGNKETDLDLQVGDEVTVLVKVRPGGVQLREILCMLDNCTWVPYDPS